MQKTHIYLSQYFKKRMLLIALLTGFLISVTLPLTFLIMSLYNDSRSAHGKCEEFAWRIHSLIKSQSATWQSAAKQFVNDTLLTNSDIANIKVYNVNNKLIDEVSITKPYFVQLTRSQDILLGHTVYGHIVVTVNTNDEFYASGILLIISTALGLVIGIIIYQFPLKTVLSEEKEIAHSFERLNHMSFFDSLTDLPNRSKLLERLNKAIGEADERNQQVAVIYLDLDRFKLINDTLGHNEGDLLLKCAAQRLCNHTYAPVTIGRIGGDEFLAVVPAVNCLADVATVAQNLLVSMSEPFAINNQELYITVSAGISIYPTDGLDVQTLLKNADAAMYKAKESGKNKYEFFTTQINADVLEKLTLQNSLNRALKQDDLVIHYQPIVELNSGRVIGIEALVRWQHPDLGLISPDKFIPLAEETGLIAPLGEWVLHTACTQHKAWLDAGYPPMYISVNVSAYQFRQNDLVNQIASALKTSGLPARYLQLEITEGIAMQDNNLIIETLTALKHLGIRLAVDDFGTGYSSLSRLKNFPLHVIKIDKAFINNLSVDPRDLAITTYIINMAQSLHLTVIAEGVETPEQLKLLNQYSCDAIQGYLFSKPLPAEAVVTKLKQIFVA